MNEDPKSNNILYSIDKGEEEYMDDLIIQNITIQKEMQRLYKNLNIYKYVKEIIEYDYDNI